MIYIDSEIAGGKASKSNHLVGASVKRKAYQIYECNKEYSYRSGH